MKYQITVPCLLCMIIAGCSGDDGPADPVADTTPPAAVADLHVTAVTEATLTIAWTAPGDDGVTGTAHAYDMRRAEVPITAAGWATCTTVAGVPDPVAAGAEQSVTIDDPDKSTLYVALKTVDEADNWSDLSNVAVGSFTEPGAIRQLTTEGQNGQPSLNDGVVVWVHGDGWDENIHVANLNSPVPSPTALTDDGGEKDNPSNHGTERIVWQGRVDDSEDWEIWVYSPTAIPRYWAHTDNETPDMYPVLAGEGDFAWLQGPVMFENVMYWNEASHGESLISGGCCPTTEFSNEPPAAHDGTVVWRSWHRAFSGPFHAYLWNGVPTEITDDIEANIARRFSIYDGTLAYEYSGDPTRIAYWDGVSAQVVAEGIEPSLYDGRIAFTVWDGHDYEIRYWDGTQVIDITDDDVNDSQPTLWGSWLAWVGRPGGGAGQIFYVEVE